LDGYKILLRDEDVDPRTLIRDGAQYCGDPLP
jgi:hypothetical protein